MTESKIQHETNSKLRAKELKQEKEKNATLQHEKSVMQSSIDKAMAEMRDLLKAATEQNAKQISEHAKQMGELKEQHAKQIGEHAKQMGELKEQHAKQIGEHAKQMGELKEQHAKQIGEHAKQMGELKEQHAKQIGEHAKQMGELKEQHAKQIGEYAKQIGELKTRVDVLWGMTRYTKAVAILGQLVFYLEHYLFIQDTTDRTKWVPREDLLLSLELPLVTLEKMAGLKGPRILPFHPPCGHIHVPDTSADTKVDELPFVDADRGRCKRDATCRSTYGELMQIVQSLQLEDEEAALATQAVDKVFRLNRIIKGKPIEEDKKESTHVTITF